MSDEQHRTRDPSQDNRLEPAMILPLQARWR